MPGPIRGDAAAAQRRARSRQTTPVTAALGAKLGASLGTRNPSYQDDPAFQRRKRQQDRDRRQQRKEKAASLEKALSALGLGGAGQPLGSMGLGPSTPPPQVPLAPVQGNRYKGAEKAAAAQAADSQRYLQAQFGGSGPAATGSAGRTMGSYKEQIAQTMAAYSVGARQTQQGLRAKYMEDELRRTSELSKARFERDLEQEKVNQQYSQLGNLSLSMIQSLAAHGLDPMAFQGDPIGAAVALGRLQFAQGGAGQLTPSQVAQLAELGLDYRSFSSSTEAAEAIGSARRGQYGSVNTAQEFLRMLQGM